MEPEGGRPAAQGRQMLEGRSVKHFGLEPKQVGARLPTNDLRVPLEKNIVLEDKQSEARKQTDNFRVLLVRILE